MTQLDFSAFLEKCPPPAEAATDHTPIPDPGHVHEYVPWVSKATGKSEQERFHDSPAKYRWLRGGLGSGKSEAICQEAFFHSCVRLQGIPHIGLMASQTYRHLMDNTIPVLRRAFPPKALKGHSWDKAFKRSDMMLYLANGSALALRTAHNGKHEQWRGPEYAYLVLDEGRNFVGRDPWIVGLGRLRYPGVLPQHLRAWMGSTTNGHDWMYDEFHGEYRTDKHADFLLLTKDNPHLPEGYYDDLLASLDEDDARQELFGEFIAQRGAVYPKLSDALWPEGNLIEVDEDRDAPTELAIDFGYRSPRVHYTQQAKHLSPVSCLWTSVDVIVDEWTIGDGRPPKDRTIGDMIDAIMDSGYSVKAIYCDPSGDSANDQEHITSVAKLYNAFGKRVPIYYPKKPWQRSKVNGEKTVRARIRDSHGDRHLLWRMDPETRKAVAWNCYKAHRDLRFPEDRDNQAEKNVSLKDGISDHDTDAARYRLVMLYGREHIRRDLSVRQVV